MELNLKKVCPALAVAFATLTSVVCAVDDMQVRNLENRVNALEQRRGANGMINPPARPVVRDGMDLWAQAEVLYMRATEDGLAYSIKNRSPLPTVNGTVKNVGYDWNWGCRAGIGYNLPHDGWDVLLNWTWLHSNESKTEGSRESQSVLQTETAPNFADVTATSAKGRAELRTAFLDFEMGREFFVSKWLTLRPFAGIRATWLHRIFKYEYNVPGGIENEGRNHNRFRGAGLRGGLDTQWGLGSGWSIIADMAFALIYGKQKLYSHQEREVGVTETDIQHVRNSWTIVRPMMDLGAGLRWDHLFDCDAYRIRIQLGWEQTTMFGFNKDMNFVNANAPGKFSFNQGDLSWSGLSLQFRFDF